ncbi:hypothetical protein ASF72_10630 [Arthrobacter sp. Leaf141]|nr:hypothetical protein [Arthrobacter sp. Leaf141]KQR02481.1 hypothetical protein ASF72_10630 [Arthrobacter sp. Leaf141]
MLNTANRALWWVPSIANLNAIKKTEVDAGINITCRVTAANFQFGITGNASITDPGLCAQIETSAPGLATVAAEMDFFRFKNDVDDVAWTTFDGKDISGYLVQRIGQIGDDEDQENTPVKVGDELQAGEFLTHDQQILSPATAGYEKFKQVFAPQAYVQRSIVVA